MSTTETHPSLSSLAESVSSLTKQIESHFRENNHETPNFTTSSSEIPLTKEYERLRVDLNTAALDLLRLINGPKVEFRSFFTKHYEMAAWQVALEFDYFGLVPLEGSISLQELAAKAVMDEDRTMHVMRFLTTQKIFRELEGENEDDIIFEHTAASATIAREPLLKDVFLMQADEMFRAASSTADSIKQSPFSITAEGCPFAVRHGDRAYAWYEKHPPEAARFARAMAGVTLLDRQTSELRDEFNWQDLPAGTVVDVGGGSGHVSLSLAKEFKHLDFIIQDWSPIMLAQGKSQWTGELESRVKFVEHDYFQPNPVHNATAFFTRQITHNLTDEDVVRFFRAFVPALEANKPGTPLLINDTVIPEPGEKTAYEEFGLRQVDLAMWIVFNSKQRTEREFRKLLFRADERLKLVKVHSKGSMGLLEVQLDMNAPRDRGVAGV
ncbi:S-adenosyl-L-methionine-dependent methyltransferase [Aaosphaeria arxii CBS 175.79]|uniref:S-adenosyl-L-methionine-dependent methyltransferase n=1 Tax=Aaosphaeria arxii CBS 175.79 TaxID=1450172 RepID=A0A6A5X7I4_9PLEO|nr:S-adenosyl-L-methionine-dependent methyltransferase [Aaosphaeria arxii CBS 175.79]KAF2008892.1 S-adenosyl-L-methionine-dependent methyltransferase [Aaosphaeria arxii CBS 175.79]